MLAASTVAVLLAAQAAAAIAPTPVPDDCLISVDAIKAPTPQFAAYPAPAEKLGKPAPVDLASDPNARQYKTRLREAARAGPNFAGHFAVAGWGCGTACLQWSVVNLRTGKVRFQPKLWEVGFMSVGDERVKTPAVHEEFYNLRFRRDSRLMIVLGAPMEDETRDGAGFYQWDGKTFTLLKFVPRKDACRVSTR
jgi:hypothetical protein